MIGRRGEPRSIVARFESLLAGVVSEEVFILDQRFVVRIALCFLPLVSFQQSVNSRIGLKKSRRAVRVTFELNQTRTVIGLAVELNANN